MSDQFLIKRVFDDRPDHPYYARVYEREDGSGFIIWQELNRADRFSSYEMAEERTKFSIGPCSVVSLAHIEGDATP